MDYKEKYEQALDNLTKNLEKMEKDFLAQSPQTENERRMKDEENNVQR